MEPFLVRMLATSVTSLVRSMVKPKPGARSVEDPVRLGRRIAPPPELRESDVAKLADVLTLRLTDADLGFAHLEPEEGTRAVLAVKAVLDAQADMDLVQECFLDPALLRAELLRRTSVTLEGDFSERLLTECCAQVVEFFTRRPGFRDRTLLALRQDQGELLRRVPDTASLDADFTAHYCAGIKEKLDQAQLFGIDELRPEERTYRLTTAYVSLLIQTNEPDRPGLSERLDSVGPLESALSRFPRLMLEGPAGSGKSTLLRRLAVHAIDGDLPARIAHWNGRIPFVIKLRGLMKEGRLRTPPVEDFVTATGSTLGGEMPPGWVSRQLRAGNALVLVDGLDELPERFRAEVLDWLKQLVRDYPEPTYLLTSRPRVLTDEWRSWLLSSGFGTATLRSMTRRQVVDFIGKWHDAQIRNGSDEAELRSCAEDLTKTIDVRRDLARLATNPLLCALICTLHRNTDRTLPKGRTELYGRALIMLLGGREKARGISTDGVDLDRGQQEKLLSALAMWMTFNGLRSITYADALLAVEGELARFHETRHGAPEVLRHLAERSGLLHEPELNVLEFRHASFQDYLAALEMIRNNHVGHLLKNADDPLYHDVLIMAVGRTQDDPERQNRILSGLIGRAEEQDSRQLWLLAAACIADLSMVDPASAARINAATASLLPPANRDEAVSVAAAGEFVVDLLIDAADRQLFSEDQAVATIAVAEALNTEAVVPLLQRFQHRPERSVRHLLGLLLDDLPDPEGYVRDVLSGVDLRGISLPVPDVSFLPVLDQLPTLTGLMLPRQTGTVPARLPAQITELQFSDTQISDLTPLAGCTLLRKIWGNRSAVRNLGPLAGLTNLKALYLIDTEITDLTPLAGLSRLHTLALNETPVSDLSPLAELTSLVTLRLSGSQVSDLTPLSGLRSLENLHMSGSPVSDLSALACLTNLRTLDLDFTEVSDLSPLARLTNLEELWLAETEVSDLSPLAALPNLRYLSIAETPAEAAGHSGFDHL